MSSGDDECRSDTNCVAVKLETKMQILINASSLEIVVLKNSDIATKLG